MIASLSPEAEAILGKATVEKDEPCGCYVVRFASAFSDLTFCEAHARAQFTKPSK